LLLSAAISCNKVMIIISFGGVYGLNYCGAVVNYNRYYVTVYSIYK
jgi:hypothetical protein